MGHFESKGAALKRPCNSMRWLLKLLLGCLSLESLAGGFERSNLTAKIGIVNGVSGLQLNAKNSNTTEQDPEVKTVALKPNSVGSIGYTFSYKYFGLGYETKGGTDKSSVEKKGYSENVRYSFFYASHNWAGQVYYLKSKGFYTESPKVIQPDWTSDRPYPQFPKMKVENFGTSWLYAYDKKDFSAEALVSQSERFKGGFSDSLLFGLNVGKTIFHDVPQLTIYFNDNTQTTVDLSQVETLSISPQMGYGVFLGTHNLYASLSVLLGPSFEASRLNSARNYSLTRGASFKTIGSTGYHSKSFFLTISAFIDTLSKTAGDLEIAPNRVFTELAIGTHF